MDSKRQSPLSTISLIVFGSRAIDIQMATLTRSVGACDSCDSQGAVANAGVDPGNSLGNRHRALERISSRGNDLLEASERAFHTSPSDFVVNSDVDPRDSLRNLRPSTKPLDLHVERCTPNVIMY